MSVESKEAVATLRRMYEEMKDFADKNSTVLGEASAGVIFGYASPAEKGDCEDWENRGHTEVAIVGIRTRLMYILEDTLHAMSKKDPSSVSRIMATVAMARMKDKGEDPMKEMLRILAEPDDSSPLGFHKWMREKVLDPAKKVQKVRDGIAEAVAKLEEEKKGE